MVAADSREDVCQPREDDSDEMGPVYDRVASNTTRDSERRHLTPMADAGPLPNSDGPRSSRARVSILLTLEDSHLPRLGIQASVGKDAQGRIPFNNRASALAAPFSPYCVLCTDQPSCPTRRSPL